jgi:hypothetical protein
LNELRQEMEYTLRMILRCVFEVNSRY